MDPISHADHFNICLTMEENIVHQSHLQPHKKFREHAAMSEA